MVCGAVLAGGGEGRGEGVRGGEGRGGEGRGEGVRVHLSGL